MSPGISHSIALINFGFWIVLCGLSAPCFAQDNRNPAAPSVELLALSGSKPNLGASGEGITSIKTSDLYKLGVTTVKPFDSSFKIELPVGYSLVENLAYMIESEAVFSGPNDFTFRVPSSIGGESFSKLRVLYADYDHAAPKTPRWVDATVIGGWSEYWERDLPKDEFDKRLPNFGTRTLHAFMEQPPRFLVVALKDSSIARDAFVADVAIKTIAPASVMEGREITYSFNVTNNGPDTATDISFNSHIDMDYVSLDQTQGVCRWEAYNVYCNVGRLVKGASATITFRGRCKWNFYVDDRPTQSDPGATPQISAAEQDPDPENNSSFVSTQVEKDPNKAPVAEITTPKMNEIIPGSAATVNIVAKATDPDGFVTDVEFFDWERPIGKGELRKGDEYEFVYKKVALGRHWLKVRVKDNLGRQNESGPYEFFVNGPAEVAITDPKSGSKLNRSKGGIPVTIHARHANLKIKEVNIYLTAMMSGTAEKTATLIGEDTYVATIDDICKRDCQLFASVIDETGVETRSNPIDFKIMEPPRVTLFQYDGEDVHPLTEEKPFDSSVSKVLVAEAEHKLFDDLKIVKLEFHANGKLIGTYSKTEPDYNDNRLIQCDLRSLPAGTYDVYAEATDSDGAVGKSATVRIVIKPR